MIDNDEKRYEKVIQAVVTYLSSLTLKYGFSFHVVNMKDINQKVLAGGLNLCSILSDEELRYLFDIKNRKNYIQWISGRYAVKSAFFKYRLEEQSLMDLKFMDVLKEGDSEPYIQQYHDMCVSMTHSFPYCIGVVSERKIGIDIERIFIPESALIKCYFSSGEREVLDSLIGTKEYSQRATVLWTRKEAVSKFLKLGMKMDFKKVDTLQDRIYYNGKDTEVISLSSFTCNGFCLSIAL
jgi:4'-phosphopantetheinyl transferase